MDKFKEFIYDATTDSISIVIEMAIIIFLVMLLLEFLKALNILQKINGITFKLTKYLGISKSANFPLLIGIIIGISYGAGAIIASHKSGDMSKKDVLLVSVFLCICHAIIEDTLLFVKIGASGFIILFVRLTAAIIITFITNQVISRKKEYNECH